MDHANACSRYGTIVFFLTIVFLLATALLNATLTSNDAKRETLGDWYDETATMLGKFRSSRTRTATFFSAVSLQVLSEEWLLMTGEEVPFGAHGYTYRATSIPDFGSAELVFGADGGSFWLRFPSETKGYGDPVFKALDREVTAFGGEVAQIDQASAAPEEKRQLLHDALEKSFRGAVAREILADDMADILIDENNETATHTICWIAFNHWPCRSGGFTIDGHGVSYLDRFDDEAEFRDSSRNRAHLYYLLKVSPTPGDIEDVLIEQWREARRSLLEFKAPSTEIGLPGTGLTLTIGDLLVLAGPLLVFFQLLYLIAREKAEPNTGAVFPQFSSPNDPLQPPVPAALVDLAERTIWALFLVLPVVVLTLGVTTRYDLISLMRLSDEAWLRRIEMTRSIDWFSRVVDLANLGCLALAIFIAIRLTTLHRVMPAYLTARARLAALVLGLTAVLATGVAAGWGVLEARTGEWRLFFGAFFFIWFIGFCFAAGRGARTMSLLSVGGIMLALRILWGS